MTERIKYFRTHAVTKSFENASIYPAHAGINPFVYHIGWGVWIYPAHAGINRDVTGLA